MYARSIIGSAGAELDFSSPNWTRIESDAAASDPGANGKHGLDGATGK